MTPDERCARCGNPLPGANSDNLDVCVPCRTIVYLEVERDELLAEVKALRSEVTAVWVLAERANRHGYDLDAEDVLTAIHAESEDEPP